MIYLLAFLVYLPLAAVVAAIVFEAKTNLS